MVTQDNSKILEKIPSIIEVKRLFFTKELEGLLGPIFGEIGKQNARKLFVYKIIYRSQGHSVVGFIIEPRAGDNLPCIIFNRGGSGEFAAIKKGMLFARLPAELAVKGYIVIASQYSGNDGGEGKDEMGGSDIEDVLNLQKILKKYSRANAKKIGMFGGSRGGMMTYLVLSKVSWIKAAVTVGAPTDEVRAPSFRKGWKEHQIKMFGGSQKEQIRRSALYWVDKFSKKTPLLIMHGSSDWRVNPLDSIELSQKLYKNYVPHRFVLFEGADHGLNEYLEESTEMTFAWFERFLKSEEPLPDLKPHGL